MKSITFDAKKNDREEQRKQFRANQAAENEFYRQLKKVAKESGKLIDKYTEGAVILDDRKLQSALKAYSEQITPWAAQQSAKLLNRVQKSNKRAYKNNSKAMGRALQSGVAESNTGRVAVALMNEQVALIKSIPVEAGLRAQRIAAENFLRGARAAADPTIVAKLLKERREQIELHNEFARLSGTKDLKEEMSRSMEVAVNRAKLIARTETARANSAFVQARAVAIGVTHYIWRTTMDGAERTSHAQMNGKVIAYADTPRLSDGTKGHAGTFPNCRCYQEPILPEA